MAANWAPQFAAGAPAWQPLFGTGVLAIDSVTPTSTGATVAYSGTATHYRVNGGAAVAVPGNPFTFAGLAPNTEPHIVELSGDGGSSWTDPETFGTLNPGEGGGEIPTGIHLASALQFTLTGTAAAALTVQAASSAALQLSGSSQVSAGSVTTISVSSAVTLSLAGASTVVTGALPTISATSSAALLLSPSSTASAAVQASSAATLQLTGGLGQLAAYDLALLRRVVAGKPPVRTVRGIAY